MADSQGDFSQGPNGGEPHQRGTFGKPDTPLGEFDSSTKTGWYYWYL